MVSYGRRSRAKRTRTSNRRGSTIRRSASRKRTRSSTAGATATGRRVRPKRSAKSATIKTRRTPPKRNPRGSRKSAASIAVFHNPFSKATQQARIPDGKATASLGTRVQAVKNFIPIDDTYFNTMHCLLVPGLNNGLFIYGVNSDQSGRPDFQCLGFSGHGNLQQNLNGSAGAWPTDATGDGGDIELKQVNALAKWRLVSQGLNIKLVNNNESNDGWFEAVRINQVKDLSDWQVSTINDSNNNSAAGVMPSTAFMTTLIQDTELINEASYQSGLLKDIHRHIFCNQPIEDTPFTELRENYKLRTNSDTADVGGLDAGTDVYTDGPGIPAAGVGGRYYQLNKGSARANELVKAMVDQHHDIIYIRLHCRDAAEPPTSARSQVLFHLCANHEIMYDSSREVSKYMKPGETDSSWPAQMAAKKANPAAADVNMGTTALA